MEFNKETLAQVRIDINAALKTVCEKHGIELSLGNIRYQANTFNAKLSAYAGSKVATLSENYNSIQHSYNLPPLGSIVAGSKIIGWDAKKRKRPVIVEKDGRKYKMSVEEVRRLRGTL